MRKRSKAEEKREAIIQAAIKVFSTKGYENATMDDVAAELGSSKALIYWYWKSKSALYSELIDKCFSIYVSWLETIRDTKDSYGKKLNRYFWEMAELAKENDQLNRLVHFGSLHHSKGTGEDFSAQTNEGYRKCLGLLEEFFQEGVDCGYLRRDLDVEALAFQLLFALEGYLYMSIIDEQMSFERAVTNLWIKLILPSITSGVSTD